jgi:hypothetical protein
MQQIAGAVDSALRTTAELLNRAVQGENIEPGNLSEHLTPLGREFLILNDQCRAQTTDISSRRFKACVIPKPTNVKVKIINSSRALSKPGT